MTCILIGPFILCHYLVYLRLYNTVQSISKLQTEDAWSLFHKTFFFVIYIHFAVNYEIFTIYEQIYGQNFAVTTNP